jgi:hypothetical protein
MDGRLGMRFVEDIPGQAHSDRICAAFASVCSDEGGGGVGDKRTKSVLDAVFVVTKPNSPSTFLFQQVFIFV